MKQFLAALALAAVTVTALAADVGVSISVGQPGFYGRIDIGSYPQPRLVYAEPLIIQSPRAGAAVGRPLYLHVPPGHAKDWRKHCGKYDACGQPVYFVQESWYNDVYVPGYREREKARGASDGQPGKGKGNANAGGQDNGKGNGKDKGKGNGK